MNSCSLKESYKILGIRPSCSYEDAKKVYRNLCKRYHPDSPTGDRVEFEKINNAWNELSKYGERAFGVKEKAITHISLFKFRRID